MPISNKLCKVGPDFPCCFPKNSNVLSPPNRFRYPRLGDWTSFIIAWKKDTCDNIQSFLDIVDWFQMSKPKVGRGIWSFQCCFLQGGWQPSKQDIILCPIAVAFDVVDALRASSCFTIFSVLTDCVGFGLDGTNFEGCAGFDFLFFHADFLMVRLSYIRGLYGRLLCYSFLRRHLSRWAGVDRSRRLFWVHDLVLHVGILLIGNYLNVAFGYILTNFLTSFSFVAISCSSDQCALTDPHCCSPICFFIPHLLKFSALGVGRAQKQIHLTSFYFNDLLPWECGLGLPDDFVSERAPE